MKRNSHAIMVRLWSDSWLQCAKCPAKWWPLETQVRCPAECWYMFEMSWKMVPTYFQSCIKFFLNLVSRPKKEIFVFPKRCQKKSKKFFCEKILILKTSISTSRAQIIWNCEAGVDVLVKSKICFLDLPFFYQML